ncbi:thioredoxin family protein [bacterium]|nr:thioredoxin family protein [bacterium]
MYKIVQFVSPTCSSCVIQKNVLEIIHEKYPTIQIENINIFSNYDKAILYGVKGAPTLIFLDGERSLKNHYGFLSIEAVEEVISRVFDI